jgi:hypothetical protein
MDEMFLLFSGYDYYPSGGMLDYRGLYPSVHEAKAAFNPDNFDWGHVAALRGKALVTVSTISLDSKTPVWIDQ